jgi:hypothetical protein
LLRHLKWPRCEELADEAVGCEPVSGPNSVLTGKLTGNFADLGFLRRFRRPIDQKIQWLAVKFPAQSNRELIAWIWDETANLIDKIDNLAGCEFLYTPVMSLRISFDTDWRFTAPGNLNWSPNQIDEGLSQGGV